MCRELSNKRTSMIMHDFTVMHDCDKCGSPEERVFEDSWTGKSLCLTCLGEIWGLITNSPATEGDNLDELLEGVNE